MKIFVSSLISGLEPIRDAARSAIGDLGHEVIMAEYFGARPASPQVACLEGIRHAGLVVLILGKSYGAKQESGLSATHEEYREARQTRPVIAFVQEGVDRDDDEAAFVAEVQGWSGGLFRGGFNGPDDLRGKIVRAVHQYEMSKAAGPVDEGAMLDRAIGMLPKDSRSHSTGQKRLSISVVMGPEQSILRPSQIEDRDLAEQLLQWSLFGGTQILDRGKGVGDVVEGGALVIRQERDAAVTMMPQGHMLFTLPLPRSDDMMGAVIEEDVADLVTRILRYAVAVLDRVDPTQRLTHVVLAASIADAQYMIWRTRSEATANRGSVSHGFGHKEPGPVTLSPALRTRAALKHDERDLVEDLVTLLRREYRTNTN